MSTDSASDSTDAAPSSTPFATASVSPEDSRSDDFTTPHPEGPPRMSRLFLQPSDFFARLREGSDVVRPHVGGLAILVGGAVQGASWWHFIPGAGSLGQGAGIGLALALGFAVFVGAGYRLGLRAMGLNPDVLARVSSVIGYAFIPMLLGCVPFGGLPLALATSAAAHVRGLEHLGAPAAMAQGLVTLTWALFFGGVVFMGAGIST